VQQVSPICRRLYKDARPTKQNSAVVVVVVVVVSNHIFISLVKLYTKDF